MLHCRVGLLGSLTLGAMSAIVKGFQATMWDGLNVHERCAAEARAGPCTGSAGGSAPKALLHCSQRHRDIVGELVC